MSLMIGVSKQTARDGRLIISAIRGVTCLAFPPHPLPSLPFQTAPATQVILGAGLTQPSAVNRGGKSLLAR